LEAMLGRKLFARSGRTVTLTEVGQSLFPLLRSSFDQMASAFAEIGQNGDTEAVTVSTTRAFAERWLIPRLERFHTVFPGITIHIDATEDVVDLASSAVDLAIRYGPVGVGEESRVLFQDSYIAVAATATLPTGGSVDINAFAPKPLLAYKWKSPLLEPPSWSTWLAALRDDLRQDFRISWFSEETLALNAAERGFGPLLCSNAFVEEQLRNGSFQQIPGPVMPGYPYRLIVSRVSAKRRSAADFISWLEREAISFCNVDSIKASQAA